MSKDKIEKGFGVILIIIIIALIGGILLIGSKYQKKPEVTISAFSEINCIRAHGSRTCRDSINSIF